MGLKWRTARVMWVRSEQGRVVARGRALVREWRGRARVKGENGRRHSL